MRKLLVYFIFWLLMLLSGYAHGLVFGGPGLNVHGELLPVGDLKAIGIKWVRGEFEDSHFTKEYVAKWRAHYKDFKQLVILMQWKQGPAEARQLAAWGVTDLEVGNEPELAQWTGEAWSPERYGKWFTSVRKNVDRRVRMYGPATGKWIPDYTRRALAAGMKPTAISFHGYWNTIDQLRVILLDCKRRYGFTGLVTEVGFDPDWIATFRGQYPKVKAPADSYIEMRSKLGPLAACYYDGPNGLFKWGGDGWNLRTATYEEIRAKVSLQ